MTNTIRTLIALTIGASLTVGGMAVAQTATPDAKPVVKKTMKHHHAHKSAPAGEQFLRAAGSEPAK
jgi:hypothetical protein